LDLKEIRSIIDLMKKNDLSEFALEREGFKIKLRRGYGRDAVVETVERISSVGAPAAQPTPASTPAAATAKAEEAPGTEVTSPMVGTFYRAPSPDAPAFVEVGAEVNEDTVVCIIEAMKQFNEIKAEKKGVVTAVLAENGKPVDYGQPLFRLK